MLNKHTYWKLNDIIDYDNFMSQATKEGYHWLGGQEPCNSTLRTCVLNKTFPIFIEADKAHILSFVEEKKNAYNYKTFFIEEHTSIAKTIVPVEEEKEISNLNLTVLSYQDENGHTLSFTEEGVRANLDGLLETIRKRFSSLVVGDRVVVVDEGLIYNLYKDWFRENNIPLDYAVRYAYGHQIKSGVKGTIRYMAPHSKNSKEMLCLVETDHNWSGRPVYLVGLNGLVKEK